MSKAVPKTDARMKIKVLTRQKIVKSRDHQAHFPCLRLKVPRVNE